MHKSGRGYPIENDNVGHKGDLKEYCFYLKVRMSLGYNEKTNY